MKTFLAFTFLSIFCGLVRCEPEKNYTCEEDWDLFETNCYRVYDRMVSFNFEGAQNYCEETSNASLLTLDTDEEVRFIVDLVRSVSRRSVFWVQGPEKSGSRECRILRPFADGSHLIRASCFGNFKVICEKEAEEVAGDQNEAVLAMMRETQSMMANFTEELLNLRKDFNDFMTETKSNFHDFEHTAKDSVDEIKHVMKREFCKREAPASQFLGQSGSQGPDGATGPGYNPLDERLEAMNAMLYSLTKKMSHLEAVSNCSSNETGPGTLGTAGSRTSGSQNFDTKSQGKGGIENENAIDDWSRGDRGRSGLEFRRDNFVTPKEARKTDRQEFGPTSQPTEASTQFPVEFECNLQRYVNCSEPFFDAYNRPKVFVVPVVPSASFQEARQECYVRGGDLISIKSLNENEYVATWMQELRKSRLVSHEPFFLNLRRDSNWKWQWVQDQSSLEFANWGRGEPKYMDYVKMDPMDRRWYNFDSSANTIAIQHPCQILFELSA